MSASQTLIHFDDIFRPQIVLPEPDFPFQEYVKRTVEVQDPWDPRESLTLTPIGIFDALGSAQFILVSSIYPRMAMIYPQIQTFAEGILCLAAAGILGKHKIQPDTTSYLQEQLVLQVLNGNEHVTVSLLSGLRSDITNTNFVTAYRSAKVIPFPTRHSVNRRGSAD